MNQAVAPEGAATTTEFPSTAFRTKAKALTQKLTELRARYDELSKKLALIQKNGDVLRIQDVDPVEKGLEITREIKNIESAISGVRSETAQLFAAEYQRYESVKNVIWQQVCKKVVLPHQHTLRETAEKVRKMSEAFSAYFQPQTSADASNATSLIDNFERGIATFNAAVAESGAPGGNHIPANDSIRGTIDHALKTNIRESGLEKAINELRDALRLDPMKLLGGFATKV